MTKENRTMTIEMIPGDQLTYVPEGKRQTRKIKELAETIKARGIINPLLVEVIDEKGKYLIRRGRRRFEAGKLAGLTEYPCLVVPAGAIPADLDTIENTQREPYTAYELYSQALQSHPEIKKGASPELIQAVAGSLGISAVEVQRIINISRMAKPVTDALAAGEISLGLALLSLNIHDTKDVGHYIKFCKEYHPSLRAGEEYITTRYSGPTNNVGPDCPFDTKDCAKCLKKGGADQSLFEDPDPENKTVCWDPACYSKKTEEAMAAMISKAKELGLAGVKPAGKHFYSYNFTIYGKIKPVDPERCKSCKSVLVGSKDRGLNIVCPDSCPNIKRAKGTRGDSSDRGAKIKSDKPVIERSKSEKVEYMNEKLALAARKFMIGYFFSGNGVGSFRPERKPTDPWRVAWYLGCQSNRNPFSLADFDYSKEDPKHDSKNPLLAKPGPEAFLKIAMMPEHITSCGGTLAQNDQSGRGPEDIDQDVELLYGIKDFCCGHYAEIIELLGKSAVAVMESLGTWRPEWAKGAKVTAPAKPGSGKKKGKK